MRVRQSFQLEERLSFSSLKLFVSPQIVSNLQSAQSDWRRKTLSQHRSIWTQKKQSWNCLHFRIKISVDSLKEIEKWSSWLGISEGLEVKNYVNDSQDMGERVPNWLSEGHHSDVHRLFSFSWLVQEKSVRSRHVLKN